MAKDKLCPKCHKVMSEAFYGMPTEEDFNNPKYIIMGCLIDENMLQYRCPECGYEIYSENL